MLKKSYIAMLLLAGLVSCSQPKEQGPALPDEPQSTEITFGELSTSDGRAALVESAGGALFRSQPFSVYGEWIDTSKGGARTEVFHDQHVTYTQYGASPSGWNYAPTQSWRSGGEYDFRAYWPATVTTMGTTTARNLALEYSILSNDEDLMVAYTHCPSGNNGQPVALRFRHTLAAVAVKFRTESAEQSYRIKNFFFTGLHYIGALGYYDTDASIDLTDRWLFADGSRGTVNTQNMLLSQRQREWSDATGRALSTSADDYPEEFALFPPQSLTVTGTTPKPSLTFTVEIDGETTDTVTTTVTLPTTDLSGKEMVWRAGKKYIYIVTVVANHFEIEVKTCDWDEVNGVTGDIHI
ncbi:MAG: fimbrillin family protein [Alistipes sp.]|nr:fimbrillin family protein [Alistipes sp.]